MDWGGADVRVKVNALMEWILGKHFTVFGHKGLITEWDNRNLNPKVSKPWNSQGEFLSSQILLEIAYLKEFRQNQVIDRRFYYYIGIQAIDRVYIGCI